METPSIVLFDGWCVLCNGSATFIARRDPRRRFAFATLQSEEGIALLQEQGLPHDMQESFVLIEDGCAYLRSAAALRIARGLRFPWPLLWLLVIVPRPLRDWIYNAVGRRRYRWFGRRDECGIADALVRDRLWQAPERMRVPHQ
jgi:predicted DCC family thiol-disulfide oxidoreductase YuxK